MPSAALPADFRLRVRVALVPRRGAQAMAEVVWTASSSRAAEANAAVAGHYFSFKRGRGVFPLSTSHSFLAMEVVDDTAGAGAVRSALSAGIARAWDGVQCLPNAQQEAL